MAKFFHIRNSKTVPILFVYATLLFLSLTSSLNANAGNRDFTVFEMRKTLPLADDTKIYHDYYVNVGTESGIKIGTILSVYRKIPVVDVYSNKAPGDLIVQIAKLKVIHSQQAMSVGRILSEGNPKSIPVVQFEKVMLGDRVEIAQEESKAELQESEPKDETKEVPEKVANISEKNERKEDLTKTKLEDKKL